jgi:crotonobetainyl-CoA:carnitine CoA-transferase CaiB-like acyl-CoA transferase
LSLVRDPLAGIRVLDLATPRTELTGRMLADLGAEVVKVEPPGGTQARRLPPFAENAQRIDSLYWAWAGVGKQSVVLDLDRTEDRDRLLDLVRGADVLIESEAPGAMRQRLLDYERLSAINQQLIYLSVTPFGQHGPKALWPATDLTLEAACGRVAMQGDEDRSPVPVGYPQASLHAGAQGAADILVALNERAQSGRGQYLDLSMFETMFWTLMAAQGTRICLGDDDPSEDRDAQPPALALARLVPTVLLARDGYITIGPGAVQQVAAAIAQELREGGPLEDCLEHVDFHGLAAGVRDGIVAPEVIDAVSRMLAGFVSGRSQIEMVHFAHTHDLRIGPLYTTRSILADPHFNARNFIIESGGVRQPGPWARLSRTPLRHLRSAPELGDAALPNWPVRSVPSAPARRAGDAFAGLRVADFSWVAAGPTISKALADHGATVIKLESSTRPDLSRTLAPFFDGIPGPNRSYWSCLYMTSKLSLACNLALPEGRALARRVVDWADVVIESFSPGTMRKLGLDYESLVKGRPELIMLSTSLLGQTGPLASFAGFGQQGSGFSGHHAVTGWPDRVPCGVYAPYTDVIAPKFGVAALAAAILERRHSGLGQHIDLAQVEASIHFIAPLILDESVNGRTAPAAGHDSLYACPHGVYPTRGTREFIAIAVESQTQWQALRSTVPGLPLDDDAPLEARIAARDVIDAVLRGWSAGRDRYVAELDLIAAGVPAAAVRRPVEVYGDPQFAARGFLQRLPHSELGNVEIWGFPTRFSARDTMVRHAPPCFGEHTDHVLRDLLGLDETDIERYRDANVFV